MNNSNSSAGTAGDIEEVELSAADLLDLAPAVATPQVVEAPATEAVVAAATVQRALPAHPVVTATGRSFGLRPIQIAATAAIVIAAATAVALQSSAPEREPVPQRAATWPPPPEPAPAMSEPVMAADPVRYANPFDPKEIFELPPGTTREEARTLVADILLKRAAERQGRR